MSQVIRKFKSGGQQPELFERKGVGKYNKQELVAGLYKGIDSYIKDNNLTGDQAVSFRNLADNFIKGIESGTITLNSNGTFSDSTGKISSTGTFDKNLFGKVKNTENNIYNLVGDYALNYINSMPQYQSPAPTTKGRFNANELLSKEISKRWYGGKDIDFENWFKNRSEQDRNQLIGDIFNNLDYNKLFQDYDWTDTGVNSVEDLISRGKAFGSAILNNTLDNDDYNRFAELGGSNLDKFFKYEQKTPDQEKQERQDALRKSWEEEAKQKGYTSEESIQAYVESRQRELDQKEQTLIDENQKAKEDLERNQYFEKYKQENPFRQTINGDILPSTLTYNPEDLDKYITDLYGNNTDDYFNANLSRDWFKAGNKQHIANQLDYMINKLQVPLPDVGDGFVAIPSTFDWNNYSTIIYNPTTRQYMETSMLANDALRKLADNYYNEHILKRKEGGVLYMQFGGAYNTNSYYTTYKSKRADESKTKKQQEADNKGRTLEQQEKAERKPGSITSGDWTGEDYTRLASIAADVGSILTAYAPIYGTTASAALGYGSSIANYGADLSENGFRWGDLGNLAVNLGLDTVGLVPGLGSAAKGSKVLKTAAKYLPRVLATVSLYNAPEVYQSVKKAMTPGTDLTVDDWRNIAEGFKMVLQGGKGIKRTIQAYNLRKDLATGNKVLNVAGNKEGQVTLTPDEFREITSHKKIEDQWAALQLIKKDDNLRLLGDLNKRWYNPTRWFPNSNVRNEYDFNKKVKKMTSQGLIEVPRVYSDSDKYIAATMQKNFIQIPGIDKLSTKYNDWKYRKLIKPKESAQSNKSSQRSLPPHKEESTIKEKTVTITPPKPISHLALPQKGSPSAPLKLAERNAIIDRTDHSTLNKPTNREDRGKEISQALGKINDALDTNIWYLKGPKINKISTKPSKRLDKMIEDQIPGGKLYGKAREKREREYVDTFYPSAEREQNRLWEKLIIDPYGGRTPQAIINERKVTRADKERINASQTAKKIADSVNKQIAMAIAQSTPKRMTDAQYKKRLGQLNATFNQRQYNMEEALRTRELPHKKSNKKKKTSKDTRVKRREFGGELFKDGGVLFLQKGQPVRSNVQTLNPNYSRADFLGSDDVLNYFRSIKDANDVAAFNQREDIYDNEYTKAYGAGSLKNWDSNTHLTTVAPNWGTGTLQGLWSKTGLNPYLWSNMSQGYGKTGDNPEGPYPDQIFGDITYQRTLGRGITPQLVQQANEILKDKGYKYEADPIHGGYRITPISKISVAPKKINIAAEDPKIQELKKLRNPSILYPNNNSDNKSNIKINPEDVLAAGRMIGGLVANNRAAALYKEGLKPTLLDTFENYVPLQGNTPAKQSAYQQAANIESLAAMPRTSDASLQLAGELDASSKAAQARFQGDLADAEMYYKTRMLGQQESDAAKARRVDVANKNKAAMNAIAAAKKQIDASKVSANYQQVIAPWLAGIENLYRQNRAIKQQLALSNYLNQNTSTYDAKLAQIMETYKNDPVKQQEAIRTLQTQAQKDLLEEKSKLVGSPWLISYGKSGTKLSYKDRAKLQQAKDFNKRLSDDNKQFHKDIMESKREHNKLIMNLSALTAALIKRGMQL